MLEWEGAASGGEGGFRKAATEVSKCPHGVNLVFSAVTSSSQCPCREGGLLQASHMLSP